MATWLCATAAQSSSLDYFIQPIVFYGAGVINGLDEGGATSDTQSFYNAPNGVESRVNLSDGTLKGYALDGSGTPSIFSQSRFGEAVTVANGAGTDVTFSLDVEGTVKSDPITPINNSLQQVKVQSYIAIYDGTTSVDASNWGCAFFSCGTLTPPSASALGTDIVIFDFENHISPLDLIIDELLSVTVPVTSANQTFKVFADLTLVANRNNNAGSTELGFLNSATFGIATAPNVTFSSASGVFLSSGGVTPVPLPATGWLLLAGVAGLASLRRRGRSI
jgi:hypothetical protein